MKEMQENANKVAEFLKGLANSDRLLILCELASDEKNVSQLIEATDIAQTSMSQHLSKLKKEGIVDFRREHRALFYYIDNKAAKDVMGVLYQHFCQENE